MNDRRVLLVACTNIGRYIINEIINNPSIKSQLVGVVNLNIKNSYGKSNYDSYLDLKQRYKLEILYVNNINDDRCVNWVKKKRPNIIIQSGWSQKFSNKFLSIPKFGCIGQHPAPLPKGKGAACINWAILLNKKVWGDSFFLMNDKYDDGPVLAQKKIYIEEKDDVKTIYDKVSMTSVEMIRENIDLWSAGLLKKKKNNKYKESYFKRRKPEQGEFFLYESASNIFNKIRALTRPYPGAFFYYKKRKFFIWSCEKSITKNFKHFISKNNFFFKHKNNLFFKVGKKSDELLKIIRIQEENKPEMWGGQFKI